MDTKLLAEIIKMVEKSEITLFEVSEGDLRIKVGKGNQGQTAAPVYYQEQCGTNMADRVPVTQKSEVATICESAKPIDTSLHNVNSPMLGVFYASPSPESEPFVKVGDRVKKGDVLCIIEAMKLMNEIASEREGVIEDVCVANGDIVEYGKTMFKIR